MSSETTNVAIACQGGGSHTAFTAGVLEQLLENWPDGHELVGISGTSGGAFGAVAVWYGLVTEDRAAAAELVADIWDDLAAESYADRVANDWLTTVSRLQTNGSPIPQLSPYQLPGSELGKRRLRNVLETHIDFGEIPAYCEYSTPELVVGTVDINAGDFDTFTNENVTVDAVLASAAIPNLFEAVEVDGNYHWDGLFSQNPPVRDLMHQPPERKPEELWIIQINAQESEEEPKRLDQIADRRNELSGNISLNQELQFVEQVSEWVDSGKLPESEFTTPTIHRIELNEGYPVSTKFDRNPAFIEELIELGRAEAVSFLEKTRA